MAREIQHFTATIPAGTPLSAPAVISIAMNPRTVLQIDWRVPSGPVGVMGFQIAMGGVKIFPSGGDSYVVANRETGSWTVTDAADSGAWQVIGYNTGTNPHSVYLAFHVNLPSRAAQIRPLIPAYELSLAPDLSKAGPPVKRR